MIGKETAQHLDRGAAKFGDDYYRAFRAAMDGDVRASVEVVVLTLGDFQPASWLALPAHLPEGEREQRALLLSGAEVDGQLRRDLRGWARDNDGRAVQAGKALQALALAYWSAHEMLDDDDADDAQLRIWRDRLAAYVRKHWGMDVGTAPREYHEAEKWAMRAASFGNPAPGWLLVTCAPRPEAATADGRPDYQRTGRRGWGGDDE